MSSVNKVILVGRLGQDPEVRDANGTKCVTLSLATSDRWTDRNSGEKKERTEWHRVVIWGAKDSDGNVLQFADVKPWKAAREIIDWDIKGRSIYGRKKPLAPKTLNRIYAGIVKYGWPEGYIVTLRNHMAAQGLDVPLPTIAANGQHLALVQPVLVNMKGRSTASPTGEPLPTQTAHAGHLFVAEPLVLSQHNSGAPRSADDPLPTITTGGAATDDHPGCARPMLVEPFVLSQGAGGVPRGVSEPIPTAPTGGAHALITSYYGMGGATDSEDPLPTVTTKDRFGMVVPVTHSQGGNGGRDIQEPLPTTTTAKGGEFAVVLPVTHAGGENRAQPVADPLPTVTGANRGELAFITAQHGEREGQAPRTHDLTQPVPTIAATGHVDLAEPAPEFDILFRMLEPHELAAAMGFNDDDQEYEFAGTKTDKIKQIGNAVSVSMMKAEVKAIMADAATAAAPARERAVA